MKTMKIFLFFLLIPVLYQAVPRDVWAGDIPTPTGAEIAEGTPRMINGADYYW